MANIASIHIEKGHVGEFFHNSREKPTKNSIFKDGEVLYDKTAKEALELYKKITDERAKKYTERTGQKLQKKAVTLLSAVVNIKPDTTLYDLQRLGRKLEEELGTRILQIAVHRDEGHIDENGKKHINQHAHILMSGLDDEGRSVRRKLTKKKLRKLQNLTAETLNMERGKDVRKTKRKRLNTYEYKEAMKIKNAEVVELKKKLIEKDSEIEGLKVSKKELEEQIKHIREEMKKFNVGLEGEKEFSQEDYKALSEIKKLLKAKDLQEAVLKLNSFETEIKERIKKRAKKLIEEHKEEKGLFGKEEVLQKDVAVKIINTVCRTESIDVIKVLEENERLKKENKTLKEENKNLRDKLREFKDKFNELKEKANSVLKAKIEYYTTLYNKARTELEKYYKQEFGNYKKLNEREKQVEKQIERKHNVKFNAPGF
ncbi:coiled-coil domain-containing protein [Caminibacter sp.]